MKILTKTCRRKYILSLILVLSLILTAVPSTVPITVQAASKVNVQIKVYQNYTKAFKVLKLINEVREEEGLNPVTMDKSLIKTAMTRASETALYWDHTRPNGTDCFTISDIVDGENIGVDIYSAEYIMDQWMKSSGHKSNILDPDWVAVGVGCVKIDGMYYWTQCFSSVKTQDALASSYKNAYANVTVKVKNTKKFFTAKYSISSNTIKKNGTAKITTSWNNTYTTLAIPAASLKYSSSNKKVATVSSLGVVKGKKVGTAKIKVWFVGKEAAAKTFTVRVKR